jgi:hypothetical protein
LWLPDVWKLVRGQALLWKWRTSSIFTVGFAVWMRLFKVSLYHSWVVLPFSKKSTSKIPSSSQKDGCHDLTYKRLSLEHPFAQWHLIVSFHGFKQKFLWSAVKSRQGILQCWYTAFYSTLSEVLKLMETLWKSSFMVAKSVWIMHVNFIVTASDVFWESEGITLLLPIVNK